MSVLPQNLCSFCKNAIVELSTRDTEWPAVHLGNTEARAQLWSCYPAVLALVEWFCEEALTQEARNRSDSIGACSAELRVVSGRDREQLGLALVSSETIVGSE